MVEEEGEDRCEPVVNGALQEIQPYGNSRSEGFTPLAAPPNLNGSGSYAPTNSTLDPSAIRPSRRSATGGTGELHPVG